MNSAVPFRPFCVLLLTGLLLSGCGMLRLDTGFSPDAEKEARILQSAEREVPDIDLLAVSPAMAQYLDEHVDPGLSSWATVRRLQELLFDEAFLNIQYDDQATLTAAETFERLEANCLSLVNLYIAMARHLGLSVEYQTVQIRPRWNRRGELVVLSEHINALGRVGPSNRYVVDFTPEVRLQQETAEVIEDHQALALYFNNLGVEDLIVGDAESAKIWFQYALKVDDELSIAWNNLGSAWNALEELDLAEYSYLKAYAVDRHNTTAINNLARYYRTVGEEPRADMFRRRLERVHNANPYFHFAQGNIAFEAGNYRQAQAHFRRALRRNDTEPDFYYALGQTYARLGEEEQAEELRSVALVLARYTDENYRPSSERLRRIENDRTILRSTSAGFTIEVQ